MEVRVTKRGRNYSYLLIADDGAILCERISHKRYNACTKDGKKFYADLRNVKPKDINKLTHINHEGID